MTLGMENYPKGDEWISKGKITEVNKGGFVLNLQDLAMISGRR